MHCKNCGCEIKENQKFCPKCGAKVINEIKINAKNTKKKIQIIVACICSLTIIIGATIGGFVWYKNNTSHISESDENYMYFDSGFSNVKITDVDSALEAISDVKDALGIGNVRKELNVQSVNTVDDNTYYRFQQYYEDIPVYGKSIVVFADSKGKALGLTANTITYKEPTNQKDRTDKEYIEKAQKAINYDKIIFNSIQDKAYLISDDRLILCCPVELTYTYDNQIFSKIFFVSSNNLDIEKEIDLIDNNISASKISGMQKTYDNIELSGNKIDNNYCLTDDERKIICCTMSDNDDIVSENIADTSDKECVDAYVNMQYVYNYFNRVLSIDSFDNNGSGILLFVSKNGYLYDQAKSALIDTLEKAESIGSKDYLNYAAIIMGEPNELFKNSPVNSIDIIAHEYTHRIVGNIVKLENGGIDEGISDIFGNLAELDSGASNDIWKLGENSGHSKYDMKDKITMDSYNHEDEGHDNAAIIAHAAYLMWNGNNDSDIFKIDTDKLAKLWYRSLYLLHSDATFNQCANSVMLVAKSMQDTGELTAAQIACVRRSFESVGIYPDNYLSKSATNGAVVHVKDIKNDNLPSYYLKVTDNKSNVIIDNEFTDENPYVVNVPDNGIYKFSVKQSKDSAIEYVTKVRVLNINRENSELNLQTGLDFEDINTDNGTEKKEETSNKDTINLLEGFWENDIQCPLLYKFFENGTVDEYYIDPLNRDKPENIEYNRTLKYQWDGKTLVINWGNNGLGEDFISTLEPITNSISTEDYGDYFSYLPNDEIFFYETSWVNSGGPSDQPLWLVKSKWRESNVSIPESNEKSPVSSQKPTISESESNKPDVNNPNEPIKWLFDSKNGILTITGTGKVTASWDGINKESIQKVVIDDRITEIDSWIFTGCSNITDIKLPSKLKKIGNHAFKDCTRLKHVNYPEGLVEIGTEAFWGCLSLEDIILPNSLKSLGDRVFADCSSAKRITIGKGLTSIPFSTFSGNTSVEFIEISNGVKTLGSYAFAGCTSLKKVIIGDGVTTIESWAFSECTSLTEIHIGSNVKGLSDFGVFKNCKSLTSIVLPEGLTTIGQQSFKGCTSLKSITIPRSVTKINAYYIDGCNALTDIYYKGSQADWNAIQKIGDYGNTESVLKHVTIHYNY